MSICPKNESLCDISTEKSIGASVPRNVIEEDDGRKGTYGEEDDGKGADGGKEDDEQQDFPDISFRPLFLSRYLFWSHAYAMTSLEVTCW